MGIYANGEQSRTFYVQHFIANVDLPRQESCRASPVLVSVPQPPFSLEKSVAIIPEPSLCGKPLVWNSGGGRGTYKCQAICLCTNQSGLLAKNPSELLRSRSSVCGNISLILTTRLSGLSYVLYGTGEVQATHFPYQEASSRKENHTSYDLFGLTKLPHKTNPADRTKKKICPERKAQPRRLSN